jgi:hypothetical protein
MSAAELLDCEVDHLALKHALKSQLRAFSDRDAMVQTLAHEAFTAWWLSAKPARRDVIARAFGAPAVFNKHALHTHDFKAFRDAWIAEFRRQEVSQPENPEAFFGDVVCKCNECRKRAA